MHKFQDLRAVEFSNEKSSKETLAKLEIMKNELMEKLEVKKMKSIVEIERADNKKSSLIKRLVMLEKIKDRDAQDEIIKELEEYSRIRRYREAQLARVKKEIEDIQLSQEEYKEKMTQRKNQIGAEDAHLII